MVRAVKPHPCTLEIFGKAYEVMDGLILFGLAAVAAMLFYAFADRSPWFVLAFAGAVCWRPSKASSRARGRSAWSKRFEQW